MVARICAFFVWAFVAGSLAFWGMRLVPRSAGVPANAVPVSLEQAVRGDIQRLFPVAPKANEATAAAQPQLASRFRVLGLVAANGSILPGNAGPQASGVVLISSDNKPPVAVRVGRPINRGEDLVVLSVARTGVGIGPAAGPVLATLAVPALPMAATGSLPPPPQLIDPPNGAAPPQGPGQAQMAPPGMPAPPGNNMPDPAAPPMGGVGGPGNPPPGVMGPQAQ